MCHAKCADKLICTAVAAAASALILTAHNVPLSLELFILCVAGFRLVRFLDKMRAHHLYLWRLCSTLCHNHDSIIIIIYMYMLHATWMISVDLLILFPAWRSNNRWFIVFIFYNTRFAIARSQQNYKPIRFYYSRDHMSECDLYYGNRAKKRSTRAQARTRNEFHIVHSPSSSSASCVVLVLVFIQSKVQAQSLLFVLQALKVWYSYLIFEQGRRPDHSNVQQNIMHCFGRCFRLRLHILLIFGWLRSLREIVRFQYCWSIFVLSRWHSARSRHHLRSHCQSNVQIHWLLEHRVRTPHSNKHTHTSISLFVILYCSIGKIGEQSIIQWDMPMRERVNAIFFFVGFDYSTATVLLQTEIYIASHTPSIESYTRQRKAAARKHERKNEI